MTEHLHPIGYVLNVGIGAMVVWTEIMIAE